MLYTRVVSIQKSFTLKSLSLLIQIAFKCEIDLCKKTQKPNPKINKIKNYANGTNLGNRLGRH